MPDLTDILRDALGCTPGARGCLVHGHGWPCDVLVDAESRVQEHVDLKVIQAAADAVEAMIHLAACSTDAEQAATLADQWRAVTS